MTTDEIIVLRRFDSLIEANIVKTKLDAYGVPCFLTEELGALATPIPLGGIRLHIFARDENVACQVLQPDPIESEEDGLMSCPRCQSKKIIRHSRSTLHGRVTGWIINTLLGLSKPLYCQHCGHEFQA